MLFVMSLCPSESTKSFKSGWRILEQNPNVIGQATSTTLGPKPPTSGGSFIGFASDAGSNGDSVSVLIPGSVITGLSNLIPGTIYVLSDSGSLMPRIPIGQRTNKRVGIALSSSQIKVEDLALSSLPNRSETDLTASLKFSTPEP